MHGNGTFGSTKRSVCRDYINNRVQGGCCQTAAAAKPMDCTPRARLRLLVDPDPLVRQRRAVYDTLPLRGVVCERYALAILTALP
jgi:hypothetical protein